MPTPASDASEVVLFGGGGHARAVADVIVRAGGQIAAVVDPQGSSWSEAEVFLSDDEAIAHARHAAHQAVVAIGDNDRRLALTRRVLAEGVAIPAVVATTATVSADTALGAGTVVLEH